MAFFRDPITLMAVSGLTLGLALPLAVAPASAASRSEQTAACKGDVMKLCFFSIPNEKKIASCLESKRDQLSPACKAMFPEKKKSSSGKKKTSRS